MRPVLFSVNQRRLEARRARGLRVAELLVLRLRKGVFAWVAVEVLLPLLPMSSLIIGATCWTVDMNFWNLPIVARTPSMPPIRSTIAFRSLRLDKLKGSPPLAATTVVSAGSTVGFMTAGGPENVSSIPGN